MKRSPQNLSHYKLTTCKMGFLVPISCVEVLPGDSFRHSVSMLVRVAPLVVPVMHPLQIRIHSFFVPNRLTWTGWEDFITGVNTSVDIPTVNVTSAFSNPNTLLDHLGVPKIPAGSNINALPVRAYNMIFNEFFRDSGLEPNEVGLDSLDMQKINWEKDYYTTARVAPQQGPAVTVPVAVDTPVPPTGKGTASFTIEDWRIAMGAQKIKEVRGRYGQRYVDYLRELGINPSDARLQRPEFLGGGRATIAFSEVLTTGTNKPATDPIGNLHGHGIGSLRSRPYRRFFEEHGYVLTLLSARPRHILRDGMPRHWGRKKLHDFWHKEDEILGEQKITKAELWGMAPQPNQTFGWVPRHEDYRCIPSQVGGEFRSEATQWHLARFFKSAPVLNKSFTKCSPPTAGVFALTEADHFKIMVYHSLHARRLVSFRARVP